MKQDVGKDTAWIEVEWRLKEAEGCVGAKVPPGGQCWSGTPPSGQADQHLPSLLSSIPPAALQHAM